MARVVVIGAGVGGLAVAARLATKRHNVTVIEAADRPGGKLHTYRRDGFAFDTGPSLLTLPAVYRDLFLKTGKALEDVVDLRPVDPGTHYQWADGTSAVMPGVGVGDAADALGEALGNHARDDWLALMRRAADQWQLTRRPILEAPISGVRDLLPLARSWSDVRTVAPWQSLRSAAKRGTDDPRLVGFIDRFATYTGSDSRRAPAALLTVPWLEQTFGSWHIGGGLGTLADALSARCDERGVTLHTSTRVVEIVTDDSGSVTGVVTDDGNRTAADIVVCDADAQNLYSQLVTSPVAKKSLKRLHKATPSFSGFVILVAVRGRTAGVGHHNVWLTDDYDAEFDSVFGGRLADDPTIYACVPDDTTMRPADHESWFILVNAARHSTTGESGCVDWTRPGLADEYADRILQRLSERGMPLADRILWREIRTPADLESDTLSPGGAIYGTSSNGVRSAFLRPANVSDVPGLYLVGGSAHPGGGLPLVGMGAELVANLIGRA